MAHPVIPSGVPAESVGALAPLDGLAWSVRPEIALPLAATIALYALGWWRLSRRSPQGPVLGRAALALVGFGGIAAALLSPLDALADRLFVAHMLQHMLLIMVAAPALLLADPFPIVVWGLPGAIRRRLAPWLRRGSPLRRAWLALTAMPVAWLLYAASLWAWHLPAAYDAALADRLVHDVEHATFFFGAVLFWWPVVHPAPRFRRAPRHTARIVYVVLTAFQTAALGLLLTLMPVVLYRRYAAVAGRGGLGPLDDQAWGGVVMWGLGGLIDMAVVLVLLYRGFGTGHADHTAAPGPARASGLTA